VTASKDARPPSFAADVEVQAKQPVAEVFFSRARGRTIAAGDMKLVEIGRTLGLFSSTALHESLFIS